MATIYKRGDVWWVRARINGRHIHRSSRSIRRADAEALLRQLRTEITAEPLASGERPTWAEAVERYFGETNVRAKTIQGYRTSQRALHPLIGHLRLDQIDRRVIAEVVSKRKATGVSDVSVRRNLAFMSTVCSAAVRWDVIPANPVATYSKRHLKEAQRRQRFLSRDEYQALLRAAADYVRPMVVLAVETGLRRSELFGLEWERIDFSRREIVLEITKSGHPRRVPLSEVAYDLLKALWFDPERRSPTFVFARHDGRSYTDVHRGFQAACRRSGIENFRWHDLRHTFASWWVQDGGELHHLSRILGHTTMQMTMRYSHLRTEDLHIAMAAVEERRRNTIEARLTRPALMPPDIEIRRGRLAAPTIDLVPSPG